MTDREKAIVMAHTGITMLTGEKFGIFHKYIEDILGHPVWTHELAMESVWEEIKEKSHDDFIKLCKDEDPDNEEVIRELWNCRNELCLRCGKYEKAYCGACDDCRYNAENMKRWRKDPDEIH